MLALEETFHREGKKHIAVSSALVYMESWYYSKYRDQYEYVTSQPWPVGKYASMRVASESTIVADAGQTAVIDPAPALAEALQHAGMRLRIRFTDPVYVVYLEQSDLAR